MKRLEEMDCIEALETLRGGLQNLNLPAISLYETFINRAIQAHKDEIQMAHNHGVESITLNPDYSGTIGGLSNA
jgi:hypothetical protein